MPSTQQTVIHDWSLKRYEAGAPHTSFELLRTAKTWQTCVQTRLQQDSHECGPRTSLKKTPSRSGFDTPVRLCQRSDTGTHECWSLLELKLAQRHGLVKDPMCLDRPTTYGSVPESTGSTSAWTTLSLESCAAPPEAVSTASPPSPQLLEQEERPSNRRARETYVHIARDEVRDLTAGAASPFKWPHSTIKRANAPHSTVNRTHLALLTKHVQVLMPWSIELQQTIFTGTDMQIERFGCSGYYNCRNDIKAILGVTWPELKDELRWAGRRDQVIDRAAL